MGHHMQSTVSIFEKPTVIMNIQKMRSVSALSRYPWSESFEDVSPITEDEITQALNADTLIPPYVFVDGSESAKFDNIEGCSRDQHIQRIAWFVKNYDMTESDEMVIAFPVVEDVEDDFNETLFAGNHRLCALIYNGVEEHLFRVKHGIRSIVEKSDAFVRWEAGPMHNLKFGDSVVSNDDASFHIEIDGINGSPDLRIWIHEITVAGNEQTVARYKKTESVGTFIEINAQNPEERFVDCSRPKTPLDFFVDCGIHLSPIFKNERLIEALKNNPIIK